VLVVDRQWIDVDLSSAEILPGGDAAERRPGDDDLSYIGSNRRRERDAAFTVGSDRDRVRNDVADAFRQRGLELIDSYRKKCDFDFDDARLQLVVGEALEVSQSLEVDAPRQAAVVEEADGVDDDERADGTPLHHFIEVADPALEVYR